MLLLAITERSFYGLQNWWLSVWSNANASTVVSFIPKNCWSQNYEMNNLGIFLSFVELVFRELLNPALGTTM